MKIAPVILFLTIGYLHEVISDETSIFVLAPGESTKFITNECENASSDSRKAVGCESLGGVEEKRGNTKKAKSLYKKSCELGSILGCDHLGRLEEKGGNLSRAIELYKKSCEGRSGFACWRLGIIKIKKGNQSEGERLLIRGCRIQLYDACKKLIDLGVKTKKEVNYILENETIKNFYFKKGH